MPISWGDALVLAACSAVGYFIVSGLISVFQRIGSDKTRARGDHRAHREEGSAQEKAENKDNSSTSRPKSEQPRAWFEVLGVSKSASLDDVKSAYRKAMSLYHPDKVAALAPEFQRLAEQRTKEINAAFTEARAQFTK